MKSESESLVENLRENNIFENDEHENNFEVEKVGRKNSVIWNHKHSDSVHVYPNHTSLNQPIPSNLKKHWINP